MYFTILLLFVGFIRWICFKICAISNAHEEENDDISEPLIIESNFGEMETELAVIEIESKKLDKSQSSEEINVIHQSISHQSQNMVPFRARGISLDPALLVRRYSEI